MRANNSGKKIYKCTERAKRESKALEFCWIFQLHAE